MAHYQYGGEEKMKGREGTREQGERKGQERKGRKGLKGNKGKGK